MADTHLNLRVESILSFCLNLVNGLEIIYFKDVSCECDYSSGKFSRINRLQIGHVGMFIR